MENKALYILFRYIKKVDYYYICNQLFSLIALLQLSNICVVLEYDMEFLKQSLFRNLV